MGIVTHTRIYVPPSSQEQAVKQVEAWMESPRLTLLAETATYWTCLKDLVVSGRISGGQVHNARIAALCLGHGISELWTADRDFTRFPALRTTNPLIG